MLLPQITQSLPGNPESLPIVQFSPEDVKQPPPQSNDVPSNSLESSFSYEVEYSGNAENQALSQTAEIVWRGETFRTPKEVKEAGGIYARGIERLLKGEKLEVWEIEKGSGLYTHTNGKARQFTRYISTSSNPAVGMNFAIDMSDFGKSGYLYMIRADAKMIDVEASLGQHFSFGGQAEQAAVALIPLDQIEGWYDMKRFGSVNQALAKEVLDKLEKGEKIEGLFEPNPAFDPQKYESARSSGAQPQLAGFDPESAAWKEPTWKRFKRSKVADNLERFIAKKQITGAASEGAGAWEWARTPELGPATQTPKDKILGQLKKVREASDEARKMVKQAKVLKKARVAEAEAAELEAKVALKDLVRVGKEMVEALKADESLNSADVEFEPTMESIAVARKVVAEAHMIVAAKKAEDMTKEVDKTREAKGEPELQSSIATAVEEVDKLNALVQEAKTLTEAKFADQTKVDDVVKQNVVDADQSVQELLARLEVLRLGAPRESGVDALKRELKAINGEAEAYKAGVKDLETQSRQAGKTLLQAKKKMEKLAWERERQKEKTRLKEDQAKALEEKKKRKKAKEAKTREMEEVRTRAVSNAERASQQSGMPGWLKTTLLGAGATLGAVAVGGIAAGVAFGAAGSGSGAAAAGAGSVSATASLLEAMEVSQALVNEMGALASAESAAHISIEEVASVVAEVDPHMALEIMKDAAAAAQPAAAAASPAAMEAALADISTNAGRLLAARGPMLSRRDGSDNGRRFRSRWAVAAMSEPVYLAMEDALRQAIAELASEIK